MSKHRLRRGRWFNGSRRRYMITGVIGIGVTAGLLATMLPLLADDDMAIAAVADTTATAVPQDGDNSAKSTLATCPARCDGNPRGARHALIEFVVTSVPANAVNLRAKLQVHTWQPFNAAITAHPSGSRASAPRPDVEPPEPALDRVPTVTKGYNEWDVSALVQGNGSYTIALRQEGYDTRIYWASRENRNPNLRPRLLLSYAVGAKPTAAPTSAIETPPRPPTPQPTPAAPTVPPVPVKPSPTGSASSSANSRPSRTAAAPTSCGSVSAKLVPSCGAWWGMYSPASAADSWNHGGAVADIEAQIGREFDLVHRYHDFSNTGNNGAFPDEYETRQMREGRILFFAWESRIFSSGTSLRWPDVYSGRHDSTIDAVAERIKAIGTPVFLGFDHEPEDEPAKGTDAEFVRAWRYIHDRFAKAGAGNAVWVWTMMGWSGHYDRYVGLYPGDGYVDWIAYDPYNFYACNGSKTWKSPATTVGGFYRWLDESGIGADKPRMLAEFGTNFDVNDASAKQHWFEEFPAAVRAHPKIKAVIYFNSAGSTNRSPTCDMTMNHDAAALAGFIQAGKDSYFRQPVKGTR